MVFGDSVEGDEPILLPSMEVMNMPAAQPSRSSVSNVISALLDLGLQPGVVRVSADGSFSVDVAGNNAAPAENAIARKRGSVSANADEAPSWEDGK